MKKVLMTADKTLSDAEILEKSLVNPQYFELLVSRYEDAFLRKAEMLTHSKEEAEYIVQETFLKIYKFGNSYSERPGASFKSWSYEILRNTCYSHYKKQKKMRSHVRFVDFAENDFEDKNPVKEELVDNRSYAESVLKLMPESFANILRLYFLEEKSQKEIAEIENISPGAVRTRIHRAKHFFQDMISNTV